MNWNQNGYSSDEVMRMQQDAVRRVREMQRQADANLRRSQGGMNTPAGGQNNQQQNAEIGSSGNMYHPPSSGLGGQPRQNQAEQAPPSGEGAHHGGLLNSLIGPNSPIGSLIGPGGPIGSLLGGNPLSKLTGAGTPIGKIVDALGLDTERIIIILMIILLLNDGGDSTLIMALCYLLF